MNLTYPIMLQLEGKRVVVVGGGKVAERKVFGLLDTGALITVISPEATDELQKLARTEQIVWSKHQFCVEDVKDAFLVFAATNDKLLNQEVKESAASSQLVLMVDNPRESDFQLPSSFRRGRLSIAVSTGGASPTLARKIRTRLEQEFDPSFEEYLEFLYLKRKWIISEVADGNLKRKLLTAIAADAFLISPDREGDFQRLYESLI